jgi:3-methyladenine DNA glycosylase/8-oxoguanine DNA glycosylase
VTAPLLARPAPDAGEAEPGTGAPGASGTTAISAAAVGADPAGFDHAGADPGGADALDSSGATPAVETRYRPDGPLDLRRTLGPLARGPYDPAFRWEGAVAWRTASTPEGPVTVRLAADGDGVRATAWGAGAEWAIAGVPELLGEGDDWSGCDVAAHPLLREVRRRTPGLRLPRTRLVFEALMPAIIEQKVTTLEARRAWRMLLMEYGTEPPGPAPAGMRVPPPADVWRRIPSWVWHRVGVTPQRSSTAMRCAPLAAALERTLAHGRTGDAIVRALTSIPGVGVWTAAETTQRSHGDPDSVSVGDYHLPAIVGFVLTGRHGVDDDGMLELLEPWRGHRQRVMRLVLASGITPPRRGPRMTIADHRRR